MRIGFDAKRLYCNFTGLGNYSRTLLLNLAEHFPENEYYLYSPKVKRNRETTSFLESASYYSHISKSLFKVLWRSYFIMKTLKKDKIQIYHGLSHEIPIGIYKSKIKSVVTIHDLIFKIYPDTYPTFDRAMYEKKFAYSIRKADRIVAISESTKKDIIRFYNVDASKIDVVYQSISPVYFVDSDADYAQRFLKTNNIPKNYMLYVGSVEERKNLKLIIEAMKFLPENQRLPLIAIGKGTQYKEEVLELIKQYNLEKDIIWFDNLKENHDLKVLYENAKVFIYPSLYEGFGLPVAEALLCKTPVITSNVSSLPEAAGPNSICVDPKSLDQMVSAIQTVLSDTEKCESMKEKGYAYALEHFSAKAAAISMMNTYRKV